MNTKRITGMLGLISLLSGAGFLLDFSNSEAQVTPMIDQKEFQPREPEKTDPSSTKPFIPPTNDPEMVIKPDVPPDPDAIITPPPIDSEMAVDPTTRQPMTSEKLEQLTPEELEKNIPERDQQRLREK